MSSNRFLSLVSGVQTLLTAISSSAGAGDANKIPATDSSGRLDASFMPTGFGTDAVSLQASETLAAGDFINLHDSGGVRMRKADASNGRRADGFVLAGVTSGATGTAFLEGINTSRTGLTVGARYFLGTTAGAITTTAPSASGQIVQEIGTAHSTTALQFVPLDHISIA